tara:strand:+ start:1989 stop:2675 length:687 start_codon:yes stop_codon:yes gene_type:complete
VRKLFENWRTFQEQKDSRSSLSAAFGEQGKERPFALSIPGDLDVESPINIILYFHGKYRVKVFDHSARLDKLTSRVPKEPNTVLVVPNLGADPQKKGNYLPSDFLRYVSDTLGGAVQFGKISLIAHSAGGKPMSNFILSLDDGLLSKVHVTYLDATYSPGIVKRAVKKMEKLGLCDRVDITWIEGTTTHARAKSLPPCVKQRSAQKGIKHKDLEVPPEWGDKEAQQTN